MEIGLGIHLTLGYGHTGRQSAERQSVGAGDLCLELGTAAATIWGWGARKLAAFLAASAAGEIHLQRRRREGL
jgi:hypothetical protein